MPLSNQASKRNKGSASKLEGDCCILNIFVKDEESIWSLDERNRVIESMNAAVDFVMGNAKKYGIKLRILQENYGMENDVEYPGIIPTNMFANPEWTEYLFELLGYSYGNSMVSHIKKKLKVKQVVTVYHINKAGRSYNLTYSLGVDTVYLAERDVLFYMYEDGTPTYSSTYAHEILHSFGAGELYFPFDESDERFRLASKYFPDDVMFRVESDINKLSIGEYTAYRIGWLRKLDKRYRVFEDCC